MMKRFITFLVTGNTIFLNVSKPVKNVQKFLLCTLKIHHYKMADPKGVDSVYSEYKTQINKKYR